MLLRTPAIGKHQPQIAHRAKKFLLIMMKVLSGDISRTNIV
ncbi:MAG: hypothetical protein ACOYUK_02490 [Patescibacteria group bacterium]